MIARSTDTPNQFTPGYVDPAQQAAPDRLETPVEPVRPSEGPRLQAIQLAPPPGRLVLIGGGVAAALVGGAIGYWLGRRHAPKPAKGLHQFASRLESAAGLAPVAMHLLANPLIRSLAMRMIVRQLGKRIEH